jgi:predicted transcriptional regulator
MSSSEDRHKWRFLSNHTQVMLYLHRNPDARLRDLAESIGISDRAAQGIVTDLTETGYITRERVGRRNRYAVNPSIAMRHPAQRGHDIGELLELLKLKDENL